MQIYETAGREFDKTLAEIIGQPNVTAKITAIEARLTRLENAMSLLGCNAKIICDQFQQEQDRQQAIQSVSFSEELQIDVTSALNAIVTLSGNTAVALLTGGNVGDVAHLTILQDSVGGRHVDFSAFTGDPQIAKAAGAKTIVDITIVSPIAQAAAVSYADDSVGKRIILYPDATFDGIGGGATNINDRVVVDGVWTWSDVQKYQFATYTDLQYSGPWYSATLKAKLASVNANAPNVKLLAFLRHDLWWFFNEAGVQDAARLWGTITAKPTAAMGQVVDDAPAWSTAQTQIEAAGYVQDATNASLSNSGALLTMPYEITLDAGANSWHCRNNSMKVSDNAWLDLLTDNIVAQRALQPEIDGWYIITNKAQLYIPGRIVTDQLHEWLDGTANVGWNLATNTGGPEGPWPIVHEAYDDRNGADTLVELFEGCVTLVTMLRTKDPGAFLCWSPQNLTVDTWRSYKSIFRTAYIAKYGGDAAGADTFLSELITTLAETCDAVEFPADNDPDDYTPPWAADIRGLDDKWIVRTRKPQNIALLADQ